MKSTNKAVAMEEFLIAIHQKVPVQLTLEKSELQYPDCKKPFGDKLILHKNTWGYGEYQITSDAEFLRPERALIKTSDFVGDTCEVAFVVDSDKMSPGHNFAKITLKGLGQTLEVRVIARSVCVSDEKRKQWIARQKNLSFLYRSLCYFRAGQLSEKEYSQAVEKCICNLEGSTEEGGRYQWVIRVFRIHLSLLNHLEEAFHLEMSQLEGQLAKLRRQEPLLYCAYYYLLFLWNPEAAGRADACGCIRECYETGHHHWLILWFLLQMEEEYRLPLKRREVLLEQLSEGCISPLLYLELCLLYNDQPELFQHLSDGEVQALHFGLVHHLLTPELQMRYSYLISRQSHFSGLMMEDLQTMYHENPTDDLLNVICQMLVRDKRVSHEDFFWYQLGVEHNLKLTELYECYMYALDESTEMTLPPKVLLYFSYNNQLSADKKAMLYAYIIRHKKQDKATYETYRSAMMQFATEQMLQGKITDYLAVIYEEFIGEDSLTDDLAAHLPSILFAREICCNHPDIVGVVVRHGELSREESAPLLNGRGIVSVFTKNAQIFLVDKQGNRFTESVHYTSHRLLHLEYLATKCLSHVGDHVRLLLYLYEKTDSLKQTGKDSVELRKRVLEISGLEPHFRQKVFVSQMEYYFHHFEGELLDYQLRHMDWEQVAPEDRNKFLEYCSVRHCNEKGMEAVRLFGYEQFDAKRLLQLSSHVFEAAEQEDDTLVKLAWYIFQNGQFEEAMLRYLCDYYTGTVPEMVQIWKAAAGFGMDVVVFSERILAHVLFTENMINEVYPVFYYYEEKGNNKKLVRAFLKRTAYAYLVHGQDVPEEIFAYFYKHVQVEENRPCLLAVLRHMSEKPQLTGGETVFADYNIHQLYEKNCILKFFQNFRDKVALPDRILKEQYVEYTTDPEHQVTIQYRYLSGDRQGEWMTETMWDVFEGIREKGFLLFQDETLEYTITETTSSGEVHKSPSQQLGYEDRMEHVEGYNSYRMLNKMMSGEQHKEMGQLLGLMKQYSRVRETARQLIKPL
jgi:hypothetical protein